MNVNRDIYLQRLIDSRHNHLIKVITGVRRCGKSYLLYHLFAEWLLAEGIPIVIVADDQLVHHDDHGITTICLKDFLTHPQALEL